MCQSVSSNWIIFIFLHTNYYHFFFKFFTLSWWESITLSLFFAAETKASATSAPEKLIRCPSGTNLPTPGCVPHTSSTADLYRTLCLIPENGYSVFICTVICKIMQMLTGFSFKLMPTVNFYVSAPPNQRESQTMQKNQACFLMERLQFDTNSGTIVKSTAATQRSRTALYEAAVIRIIVIVS